MDVGEGGPELREDCYQAFPALLLTGKRIEFDEVFFDKVVGAIEAALVDDVFEEGANDLLVCFRHRWTSGQEFEQRNS